MKPDILLVALKDGPYHGDNLNLTIKRAEKQGYKWVKIGSETVDHGLQSNHFQPTRLVKILFYKENLTYYGNEGNAWVLNGTKRIENKEFLELIA